MRGELPFRALRPDRISLTRCCGTPLSHDGERRDGNAPKSLTSDSPLLDRGAGGAGCGEGVARLHWAFWQLDPYYLGSIEGSPSAQQVKHQDDQPHNQEQMDHGSADMQTEAQKPQD
jgi:hypothetical protein